MQKRKTAAGTVLLLRGMLILKRASRDPGCSPPPSQVPWPCPYASCQARLAGRQGQLREGGRHSPHGLCQLSPSGCLPGPVWAPSQGQVGAHCPRWAGPGPEGLAVLLLLRGGGQGGGLAPGLGALSSRVPSTAGSGRQQRQNCGSQLPAPHGCLLPSLIPTRLLHQPPTSFCSFLWQPCNAAQPPSLPPSPTPGDARLLRQLRRGAHTSPSRRCW